MKSCLILCTAFLTLATTVAAGVPSDPAPTSINTVRTAAVDGKLLPWQEVQPFYWDRTMPVPASLNQRLRRLPLRSTIYLPTDRQPGRPVPVRVFPRQPM